VPSRYRLFRYLEVVHDRAHLVAQRSLGYDLNTMPRPSSHILELARRGAEQRVAELRSEIATLTKYFPHLRGRGGSPEKSVVEAGASMRDKEPPSEAPSQTSRSKRTRRRPRWSAAAKKAVSLRMKKYWAARRAEKK
jgi:hypothetical protein